MDVEINIARADASGFDTLSLSLELDATIGDIKDKLTATSNIDNDSQYFLFHINSGLLVSDGITLEQCTQTLSLSEEDSLSFHLAKMIEPSALSADDKEQKSSAAQSDSQHLAQTKDNSHSATEHGASAKDLRLEIERLEFRPCSALKFVP